MNTEVFAEWLKRQRHRLVLTDAGYWYEQGPSAYQSLPYHRCISPGDRDFRALFSGGKTLVIRYSAPHASAAGKLSYHVTFDGRQYGFENLQKKARYDVRKGLEYAACDRITVRTLATEGWPLRASTLRRQGRPVAESIGWWQKMCLTAEGLPGFEAWGAWHGDTLVASLLGFQDGDCFSILYQQSLTEHLASGVNNALTFVVTRDVISRVGTRRVFYGLQSLDAPISVDEFKFRMGFQATPVRQRVVFNPLVAPFCNRTSYELLKRVRSSFPANRILAKGEGMMRFYLEGQRPLGRQDVPLCLSIEDWQHVEAT